MTFLEQQQLKLVREALSGFPRDSYPRYRGIQANERLTLDSHPDGPMSLASVHATLNRIRHQLVVSPAYEEAYRIFFDRHPEFALEANVYIFDSMLRDLGEDISVDVLEDLFQAGSPNSVRQQLSLNGAALQAQAAEHARQALAEKIIADAEPLRTGGTDREAERAKRLARE